MYAHPVPITLCALNSVFDEVAESLRHGFATLGHPVEVLTGAFRRGSRAVLLGAQLVPDWNQIPDDAIIFNFEQLGTPSRYITEEYLHRLGRHTVWDYSPRNIAWMREHGINSAVRLVRIGHSPELVRIPKAAEQDIDVLFYGAVNERRLRVLQDLHGSGVRLALHTNLFGTARDAVIARSRVVLNMHYYETKIFEIARVGYLLDNAKAVVTEAGPDTELEDDLRAGLAAVPYEALADTCRALVADETRRRILEETAQAVFSRRDQAAYLRGALDEA